MKSKWLLRALPLALLGSLLVALPLAAADRVAAQSAQPKPEAALEPLAIVTDSGTHQFSVEVMRTQAQLERGLMFRRYLPPDRGMLFDFTTEQPIDMWMKNTYLPLDMIFMSRQGRVTNIAADAEPLSEKIIPSGGPVYAVLEVNAGTAAKLGVKVGDKVENELFNP